MPNQLLFHTVHMSLNAIIQDAPTELVQGLSWFAANAGKTVKWGETGKTTASRSELNMAAWIHLFDKFYGGEACEFGLIK